MAKARSFELLGPRQGARLLDAGCGTGQDALALLAEVLPGGEVVGVDSSSRAVSKARARAEHGGRITFEQADVTALPFPNARFDGSRSDRTLLHVPRPEQAIAELVRVTRPGGRVVVSETMLLDDHPAEAQESQRGQAKQVLPFLPLLLSRLGVGAIFVDISEASLELPPDLAEILGTREPRVTVRFLHIGGTVAERG